MNQHSKLLSTVFAIVIGLIHSYLLVYLWAVWLSHSSISIWLLENGIRGNSFFAVNHVLSLFLNVLASIPAAYLLTKLKPGLIWFYVAAAVLPSFVWLNTFFLYIDSSTFTTMWPHFAAGWIFELASIPLAVILVRYFQSRNAPNYAIKGTSA